MLESLKRLLKWQDIYYGNTFELIWQSIFQVCVLVCSGVYGIPTGKSIGSGAPYYGAYSASQTAGGGFSTADGQQYFNRRPDGSYDYGYNTGTGAYLAEAKTAGGHVSGKYGHTGPDGSFVNVEYQAVSTGETGAGLGQYTGDQQYPSAVPAPLKTPGSFPSSYRAPSAFSTQYRAAQVYEAGAVGPQRPVEHAAFQLERQQDGSYRYSYSSSDSSKTESGTPDGQVQGSFTFRGDDGVQRTIDYTAGEQGFLASGAHIPTTDDGTPAAGTSTGGGVPAKAPGGTTQQRYSAQAGYQRGFQYDSSQYQGLPARQQAYPGAPGSNGAKAYQYGGGRVGYSTYGGPVDESPKPFAFTYNAGDHGRQESQDASGTVRGSYVVNTPDGTQKEITYQADDSGFHVLGEKQVQAGGAGVGAAPYSAAKYVGHGGQAYKPKSIHAGGAASAAYYG